MSRAGNFLVVTWWGGGNVHPLVALCRRMIERGHKVRVLARGGESVLNEPFYATAAWRMADSIAAYGNGMRRRCWKSCL